MLRVHRVKSLEKKLFFPISIKLIDQLILTLEIAVYGSRPHFGPFGYHGNRGSVVPVLGKQFQCGLEYVFSFTQNANPGSFDSRLSGARQNIRNEYSFRMIPYQTTLSTSKTPKNIYPLSCKSGKTGICEIESISIKGIFFLKSHLQRLEAKDMHG
jgi:hypothetical protein